MKRMCAIAEMAKVGEPHEPIIAEMKEKLIAAGAYPHSMTVVTEQRVDLPGEPFQITVTGEKPDEEICEKEADEIS